MFCALDLLVGTVTFTVVVTLLSTSAGLLVTLPFAVPFLWLLFVCSAGFGRMERSRAAALLDTEISDPHPPLPPRGWFARLWARVKTGSRWREIAYHLVKLPEGALTFSVAVTLWSGSLALLALPAYVRALPGDSAEFGLFDVSTGGAWIAAVAGLVGVLFVAPWVTVALGDLSAALARALLGPPREPAPVPHPGLAGARYDTEAAVAELRTLVREAQAEGPAAGAIGAPARTSWILLGSIFTLAALAWGVVSAVTAFAYDG